MSTAQVPVVMSIAGSDPSGGAGVQADLAAIRDLGGFGAAAITALTVQDTAKVHDVVPVDPALMVSQARVVWRDLAVDAIKIGLLPTPQHVAAVARWIRDDRVAVPVVLDPVLVATSGDRLAGAGAAAVMVDELLPHVALVTPNAREAAVLDEAGARIARQDGTSWLVTGGDVEGAAVVDVWHGPRGTTRTWRGERVAGGPFHGTGCTLSSAVAVGLARRLTMEDAIDQGIRYVRERLRTAWRPGRGAAIGGVLR